MKNKGKVVLTESRLKKISIEGFAAGIMAYIVLWLCHITNVFALETSTWYSLVVLTAAALVQWAVLVCILYYSGSLSGKRRLTNFLKKTLTFIPAYMAIIALIYMAFTKNTTFKINGLNFVIAVIIFAAACVIVTVIIESIIKVMRKHGWLLDLEGQISKLPSEEQAAIAAAAAAAKAEAKREAEAKKGAQPQKTEQPKSKQDKNDSKDIIFPDLIEVDEYFAKHPYVAAHSDEITLKKLCDGFNDYLESRQMYYSADTIRAFVSGMACSHFLILEGMSGTGKTSLPKFFAEYTGCDICFTSVQASWRDRSDVLGYYNDFSGGFKESPFLRSLYTASYRKDEINLMVLDEMNLSRVEYYFADFLSVLELDPEQWEIELMPSSTKGKQPAMFTSGYAVRIPENTWFIGTANKDDSTFTITDKVYDRAAIIDFSSRNASMGMGKQAQPIRIGTRKLTELFREAVTATEYGLNREEYARFSKLGDFMLERFDVNFGNRILNQIMKFIPVFEACGGTAAKALDLMFARKILRKLDGRFDDGLKLDLSALENLITELYGKEEFSVTIEALNKMKRKLI